MEAIEDLQNKDKIDSVFQLYYDFLYKYLSILMLTSIASIAYAIPILEKDISLTSKIAAGLSIVSWALSVAFGINSLIQTLKLLGFEYSIARINQQGLSEHDEEVQPKDRHKPNVRITRNRIRFNSSFSFMCQLILYVVGMMLFLCYAWFNTNWSNTTKTIKPEVQAKAPSRMLNKDSLLTDSSIHHSTVPILAPSLKKDSASRRKS